MPTTAPLDDETARDSPSTPRPAPSAAASTEETASDSPFLRFLPPSRGSRRVERSKPFWELREQWSASATDRAQATERANAILEAAPPAAAPAKWGGPPQRAATARAATPTSPVAPAAAKPPTMPMRRSLAPAPVPTPTMPNLAKPSGAPAVSPKGEKSVGAAAVEAAAAWKCSTPGRSSVAAHQITSPLAEGYHVRTRGGGTPKVPRELRAMGGTVAKKGKRPAAARAPLSANVARAENRGQQGPRLAFRL